MRKIALIIAIAFSSSVFSEERIKGEFGNESKNGTDKSVSIDTNGSTWGLQALRASQNPTILYCLNLTRNPVVTLPDDLSEPGSWKKLPKDGGDAYPVAVECAICSHLLMKSSQITQQSFKGEKVLPMPNEDVVSKVVARLPVETLLQQAKQESWFAREQFIQMPSAELAWRVTGTGYAYDSKKGYVAIIKDGNPWFDEKHLFGRVTTFKQASNSSIGSSVSTKYGGELGGKPGGSK